MHVFGYQQGPGPRLFGWFFAVLLATCGSLTGQVMRIEFEHDTTGLPGGAQIQRLDYLLSGLALRRADGTWIPSQDWQAFISHDKQHLKCEADGTPREKLTGIRFDVGLPPALNQRDPSSWPAGHALNPNVNGLHWGWQGGYIFMALEGLRKDAAGQVQGFSYHLAEEPQRTSVVLDAAFQGGGPVTLRVRFTPAVLLRAIDFPQSPGSTHSRQGDPVAERLARALPQAFRVVAIHQDLYQAPQASAVVAAAPVAGTHPWPARFTQRFPQVSLPSDNPLTLEGVALGEKLFHDPRLSINNAQSCASCHDRSVAFADARRFSVGALGHLGSRNSMPLFNLAWNTTGFFWDGRSATLREQVLKPVEDTHEMAESADVVAMKLQPDMGSDFKAAFGSPEVTPDRMARAMEQYLLTLVSQESRFDQAVRKVAELSEEEKRGLQLFVTEHDPRRGLYGADCFHCHGGTLFTDHQFKNNGLELAADDLGRMKVTGREEDRGKFKTPSLRNVALTAPYMHDGRFASLEEVVEHYSSGVVRGPLLDPNLAKHPATGLQLSSADKRALVAFLKTLTDEAFASPGEAASTDSTPTLVSKP